MTRNIWKSALALSAVLAVGGAAGADDRDARPLTGGPNGGTTVTLGGKGTAAQAASEDTELTHGYRYGGHHGGHYGWGGGYGYRGYYGGYGGYGGYYSGYRGYYGGYSSFGYYRPAYYYAPRPYYYSSFYYPTYYSYGPSLYLGIGGGVASGAPTVALGEGFAPPTAQPMTRPAAPGDGTFPYDGGPINPVPLPKGEPQTIPPANPSSATDLPISLKPKAATTPYKYKAYGEK